jgi:hypothetical protein
VGWSGAADRDPREPHQDVATVEHLGRTASAPHPLVSALTVNVVPADGCEHLVAGPVVHRVLEDGSATGGRLGLLEGRYPVGWTGPPPHVCTASMKKPSMSWVGRCASSHAPRSAC